MKNCIDETVSSNNLKLDLNHIKPLCKTPSVEEIVRDLKRLKVSYREQGKSTDSNKLCKE